MTLAHLDLFIRGGSIFTMLLLAWLLLHQRRQIGLPAILFAPMALCLSGFVSGNTPISSLVPEGALGSGAHIASGFTVIFLWWFCLSCFDRQFSPRGGVLSAGLMWSLLAALDRGLFGNFFASKGLSILLLALGFAIVAHLVWRILAERQGDLIQQRHDARILAAILLGGMLFMDLAADALFGFAWRPLAFSMAQNAMVLAFGVWLAGRMLVVRPGVLAFDVADNDSTAGKSLPQRNIQHETEMHRRLSALMITERIFLDPELTFATFVKRMGASERTVRTLINHELGYDHFRTFLNHYRVAEARRLLADASRNDKLATIALESGFASLASFNRAFRTLEECTPSDYRSAISDRTSRCADVAKARF